ncbi:unnamed protein product [Polarella glacialis]|uniref:Glucosidase 2 subunit beta n=1 Tax=Polarella glacialis TaxID=89957 RepID=A0A813JSW4_POLGL|nr:unnamed protein product [Polarella glacialis]
MSPAMLPRGAFPEDLALYARSDGHFVCRNDVAKAEASTSSYSTLLASAVNDDYCDCPDDGSDEPGTSACSRGHFYCHNEGSIPQVIRTSLLNDGVCDCCDGSDEWAVNQLSARCDSGGCGSEMSSIAARLALLLREVRRGELLAVSIVRELHERLGPLQAALDEAEAVAKPYMESAKTVQKTLQSLMKKRQKEHSGKAKATPAEVLPPDESITGLFCFPAGQEAEPEAFSVNASCMTDEACTYVCSYLCSDARRFNGICGVGASVGEIVKFSFDPDAKRREAMMVQNGQAQGGELEELAIEYLVVSEGFSTTDAKWLEQRQKLAHIGKIAAEAMNNLRKVQAASDLLKMATSGKLGPEGVYHDLYDQCLNVTQDQYVGTTAVREQWHSFQYKICFFQHASQQEVPGDVDQAAVWDESGSSSVPAEDAKEVMNLGRPVGMMTETAFRSIPPSQLGLQAFFFEPSDHLFLFAGGGQCPGGVHRALAVQFVCGEQAALTRVREVRMCAYVAEVSHPGPCDLDVWPSALRDLAREDSSQSDLEASIRSWLQKSRGKLSGNGRIDWVQTLKTPEAARHLLLARLAEGQPGPVVPLVTLEDASHAVRASILLLQDVARGTSKAVADALPAEAWMFKEKAREAAADLLAPVVEPVAPYVAASVARVEEMGSMLMQVMTSATASVSTAATEAQMISYCLGQAQDFQRQRPTGRRFRVPDEPEDVLVMSGYLVLVHLLLLYSARRLFGIVYRCSRRCCCCRCSALHRRAAAAREHQSLHEAAEPAEK